VVTYDAGNLPAVVAGLGQVVATGDVQGLARALRGAIAAARGTEHGRIPTTDGNLEPSEWLDAVARLLERHSRERYDSSFLETLAEIGVDLRKGKLPVAA
jgi:hypothetical protein